MALPKIDTPIYELELPLSKKVIKFRPFLVKEQRNLLMAMESDDKDTIEKSIQQVLNNCTLTEGIVIGELPILDVEYYFINLRARSVGEVVESKYRCENKVNDTTCGNMMDSKFNLLDIKVQMPENVSDTIQLNDKLSIKMRYPQFSVISSDTDNSTDLVFTMIANSIESIFDGQQYYYAKEYTKLELLEFIESLNQEQFNKIEEFFNNMPTLNKKIEMTCSRCGFHHEINAEGLDSFFA